MSTEYRKHIPKDKSLDIPTIVKNAGYYDIDNNWNSILTFPQYPGMLFRGRVEVFIFDERNNVYVAMNGSNYRIPGGSLEKDRSHKYQVEQEAKEEAGVELGLITYTGYNYFNFFKKKYTSYPVYWDGSYNEVYIANFKRWHYGTIKKSVMDLQMNKYGKFIPFESIINILTENHQKALNLIPR